ncbi:ATP12 family chaperone protein [Sphingobium cloacae]|uniref:ATP synthase mitochondrial F1 complex assemblyfactor 2 n=1 Tax=Sphingobium cloacae TaxID=120107 RepID=A0A1E1F3P6_9SPHN|nr:ATP12 family protein [Sphingobium cloacae]BAV65061.1 ATP synthase mitochondrial F1 complex assemblyfactor 2 [Sphingobium cloacae]
MKRFYQDAAVVAGEGGFGIQLDGRPVRTPARALLALPDAALAEAVAREWRAQGDAIDPRSMPFTGLANAAIDQIAPHREAFAAGIARYAETDLLCYRAEAPEALVARQAAAWDPLLDWAVARYDVAFRVTRGLLPVAQPPETLERLAQAVEAFDPFTLAGLSTLVTLSGSLVCGLAVVEGGHEPAAIWAAAEIDEVWQAEQWGEDAEAAARGALRREEFSTNCAFCALTRA